jgi:hypothetical protein
VLLASAAFTACTPKAPPSWERGNCLAPTPSATQLTLLRARVDSSPLFLRGATDVPALEAELIRGTAALDQDTIWVPYDGASAPGTPLSTAWWRAAMSVHSALREVGSLQAPLRAVGRFALDSARTAYLLYVPAVDFGHHAELWIIDRVEQCVLLPQSVAVAWGDGGESVQLESWLVDLDGDGIRELVQRTVSAWTIESPADTLETTETSDSLSVFRWRSPRFVRDSAFDVNGIPWARTRVP